VVSLDALVQTAPAVEHDIVLRASADVARAHRQPDTSLISTDGIRNAYNSVALASELAEFHVTITSSFQIMPLWEDFNTQWGRFMDKDQETMVPALTLLAL
jgi:hypothetical protein